MTWVKLDDQFTEHTKVDRISDAAFRLHISALCHCARLLTDGFVAADRVKRLVPRFKQSATAELVSVGLWHDAPGGWMIHDYLLYNPSSKKVKADREAARKRMASNRSGEVQANIERSSHSPSRTRPTDVVTSPSPLTLVGDSVEEKVYAAIADLAVRNARNVGDVAAYRKRCLASARTTHGERVRGLLERFDAPADVVAAAVTAGETHSLNNFRRRPA